MQTPSYSSKMLYDLFSYFVENTKRSISDIPSLSTDEGNRHLTVWDSQFGTKLHFSLPILPEYPGDIDSIIGLYAFIEIPFFANIHIMINYDQKNGAYTVRNISLCYDAVDFDSIDATNSDLATFVGDSFIKLFMEVHDKKTALISDLIRNKFRIGRGVEFSTLYNVPGPMSKNNYLYFVDEPNDVVFVNDATGTNRTSAINNTERLLYHFNPDLKPKLFNSNGDVSPGLLSWFKNLFSKPEEEKEDDQKLGIVIVMKNLDDRSIIYLKDDFSHYSRSSSYEEINAVWSPLLSYILPIKFR